jgi:RimJ/RimL family protein N-acetyltransferase
MLILEQYGVKLTRLQREDIELVRHWRNHPDISSHMEYREPITAEAQVKWFDSINNPFNYYFLIEYNGKKIGLINSKHYDPVEKVGEGGIFIWDKEYLQTFVPVMASLCLLNFVFFELKLCKRSRARILRDNARAIQFNKAIGYKLLPGQENVNNQMYELTLEDYQAKGASLNEMAAALAKGENKLTYSGNVCPENLDEINNLLSRKKS